MLKIQQRLGLKLIAGFILLNLIGTLSTALIIYATMNEYYKKFVFEGHVSQAFNAAALLSDFYMVTGSWQGIEDTIHSLLQQTEELRNKERFENRRPGPPPKRFFPDIDGPDGRPDFFPRRPPEMMHYFFLQESVSYSRHRTAG